MCQSKAEGGRRCYAHLRQRELELAQQLQELADDSDERARTVKGLETVRHELLGTRTGLAQHIAAQTAGPGPYDAAALADTINSYLFDAPQGRGIALPGGSFRATRAHVSRGHTVLEVSGPTSAKSYSRGLATRYDADPVGKQVSRVSTAALQRDFSTLLVLADGRAGAGVTHTGEIAAIYSTSPHRGVVGALLPLAIARGGTHLECFDTYLPQLYARSGFTKVASIPFDRDFAPDGWDYPAMSRLAPPDGEPDITFMASSEHYQKLGAPEFRRFAEYDDAEEYTRTGRSS